MIELNTFELSSGKCIVLVLHIECIYWECGEDSQRVFIKLRKIYA